MKKKFSLLLALALALSLAACGSRAGGSGDSQPPVSTPVTTPADTSAPEQSTDTAAADPAPTTTGDGGILIACFGVPETDGTDTVANASRVATEDGVAGNCQFIAQAIQQAVGGDLFAIETVQEYPGTHQPLLDFAYEELRQDARPELSSRHQQSQRIRCDLHWLPHLVGRCPCHDGHFPGGERFQRQSGCPLLHQFVQSHRQQPAYLPGTGFRCDRRGWIDRQQ